MRLVQIPGLSAPIGRVPLDHADILTWRIDPALERREGAPAVSIGRYRGNPASNAVYTEAWAAA